MQLQEDKEYIGGLIHEGFYDKLIIIGFPYDEGAKKSGVKHGQDYGADSFRRFLKNIGSIRNPEYSVDISKGLPAISDYGNIQITHPDGKPPSQDELLDKLSTKVNACIKRGNIPFVVGGTRDMSLGVLKNSEAEAKRLFIYMRQRLDLDEGDDLTIKNSLRKILQQDCFQSGKDRAVIFGFKITTLEEFDRLKAICPYADYYAADIVKLSEQIYSIYQSIHQMEDNGEKLTSSVSFLMNYIKQSMDTFDQVYFSVSMEAIEGATGVSSPLPPGEGILAEDVVKMFHLLGKNCTNLVAVEVSDYNPFIEDQSTGRLIATMFYNFALGVSQRLQ